MSTSFEESRSTAEIASELRRRGLPGSVRDRIARLDRWARAWEDPGFGAWDRVHRLAPGVQPLHEAILTLLRSARSPSLESLLVEQLGHVGAFEEFAPRPGGGYRKAVGPHLVAFFASGGADLSTWPLLILSLLAGSPVFVRMSTLDREWPVLFRSSVADIDPELSACVRLDHWSADDEARHRELCGSADLVVVHGSDRTVDALRRLVPPGTRFLGFGSRVSVAVVGEGADLSPAATAAAVDLALYDQAGCLSPQAMLVQGSLERAQELSRRIDEAMTDLLNGWPPDTRTPAQNARIRAVRETSAFEESSLVLGPADLRWTLICTRADTLELSPLGRTLRVYPWEGVQALQSMLQPVQPWLQAAGVCGGSPSQVLELAHELAAIGVTRVCPLGRMQQPTLHWSHDGLPLLASMVRFVDLDLP